MTNDESNDDVHVSPEIDAVVERVLARFPSARTDGRSPGVRAVTIRGVLTESADITIAKGAQIHVTSASGIDEFVPGDEASQLSALESLLMCVGEFGLVERRPFGLRFMLGKAVIPAGHESMSGWRGIWRFVPVTGWR